MLISSMPELLATGKRVGLHYKRCEKYFTQSATLTPNLALNFVGNLSRFAKVGLSTGLDQRIHRLHLYRAPPSSKHAYSCFRPAVRGPARGRAERNRAE